MGCSCILGMDAGKGPVELVYDDNHLVLNKRPKTYQELVSVVLKMIPAARSEMDVVMEYCASTGVKTIINDISLQEAYAVSSSQPTIIGLKLAKGYIPFEVRQRGSSYHTFESDSAG